MICTEVAGYHSEGRTQSRLGKKHTTNHGMLTDLLIYDQLGSHQAAQIHRNGSVSAYLLD